MKRCTSLRTLPGSFRDFPAPRFWLLNGQDARSPSVPRFWPEPQKAGGDGTPPYRWLWPGGGRLMRPSPHCCVTKNRARRCQRSAIPPFNGTTILYYTCALTHKGKFRVSSFWFVVSGFRVSGFELNGYGNAWQVQRGRFLARPSQA